MADAAPPTGSKLEEEANSRLKAAREWKKQWDQDFRECYFLASPHRQRTLNSQNDPQRTRVQDAPELNTDLGFLITQDFVTEIVNTYMPEAQMWCERGKGMDISDEIFQQIEEGLRKSDQQIFAAMKASNLYAEVTKAFYPDLAIGTAAMWIQRPHPKEPIVVSALPLRELEVNLGPYGEIDDRFAVRHTRNCYVQELLGDDIWQKVPAETKALIEDKPADRTKVTWGFWRDWDDHGDEVWQHTVLLDRALVHDVELKGEGSCPLLVMRFNPSADWPWGLGPLMMGLPSFRQIDEFERMHVEAAEMSIKPPITYPSDSFSNIEQGLEPGMAYPVSRGDQDAVKSIYNQPSLREETFIFTEKVKNLRKLFFVDYPEQTGDTPPTLGQWLDEMARAQRRIGTPGQPFWREGPAKIFLRFKYLLEASGALQPIQVNGRAVSLLPYNPAQAAAENQEVGNAVKAIQILGGAFPEGFKAHIDDVASMEAILKKMRVDLLKFRKPEQVQAAVDQIAKLIGARQPNRPGEGTPGPAATGP